MFRFFKRLRAETIRADQNALERAKWAGIADRRGVYLTAASKEIDSLRARAEAAEARAEAAEARADTAAEKLRIVGNILNNIRNQADLGKGKIEGRLDSDKIK